METVSEEKKETRGRKPAGKPIEERKIIYNQKQKEKNIIARQRAKQIRENEDITKQRLYFLSHIVKSQNLTWGEVSKKCGLSEQALSWIRIKDDTKLQNLKLILKSLGMQIEPEFATDEDKSIEVELKSESYELIGEIPSIKNFIALDNIVNTSLVNHDEMYFLARFLTENKITIAQLSKKTNISVASYKNSFEKQNIQISTLYKIAEAYNTKLIWRVKSIK